MATKWVRMRRLSRRVQTSVLVFAALLPAATQAQTTVYWNGTAPWGDTGAWSGDAAGTLPGSVPTAADTAFFSATPVTTGPTVGLLADRALAGLSFGGSATGTTTLTGGGVDAVLTLGSGGLSIASDVGSAVTIGSATANQQVALAIGADQTWTNNSTNRALSILNAVSRATGDTTGRTLTIGGAGSTLVSGVISNGGASGALGVTKTGAGTLTLSGTNLFTGPLTISAGTVAAAADSALGGGSSQLVFGNGGTLAATGNFSLGRTLQLASGTSNVAVASGNTLTLAGSLAGTTATTQLAKSGFGTLVLSQPGPSTWSGSLNSSTAPTTLTGGLLVNAGSVEITNSAALGATSNIIAVGAAQGAGIALPGGITLPNTVVLNLEARSVTDGYFHGNGLGQLSSTSGANTVTGLVNLGRDHGTLGAAVGATLNITGGILGNAKILAMVGPGDINISGGGITNVNGVQRLNSGTTTITTSIGMTAGNGLRAAGGGATLALAGPAAVTNNTRENLVRGGGTIRLDNTSQAVSSRTGGAAPLRTGDGTLNLVGNAATPVIETMGALAAIGGYTRIAVNTTAQNTSLQFASLSLGNGTTLLLESAGTGANFGTAANRVEFRTTIPTLSPTPLGQGILARAIVDDGQGWNFATYSDGSLRAFSGYDTGSLNAPSLPTTSATSTVQVGSSVTLAGSRTVNAVKLTGGGLTLGGAGSTLTLTSGGLLATGGTSTIGAGFAITSGATPLGLTVADGSTVNIASPLYTTNAAITRGGGGTVELSAPIYSTGHYFLNGGTTRLAAGGSLYPGQGTPTSSVQNLSMSYGAVLDLNGTSTLVGQFQGPDNSDFLNSAGEVTSATPAVLATRVQDNSYAPVRLTGGLSVLYAGRREQWYTSESTYTGRTAILGSMTTLKDGARLTATSALDLNYGSLLRFWNGGSQFALPDRVNDAAPVTFRGGYLEHVGRPNADVTETLGATTVAQGLADIYIDRGTHTSAGSTVLTLASLATTGGSVNFRGRSTGAAPLGLPGDNPRVIITANETAPGAGLTNNILGAWAVVEGTDFASYVPGRGVGALNQVGFAGYDGTTLPGASAPTQNIKLAADGTVPTDGYGLNSLVFSNNIAFANATDTLNLTSGGLLRSSVTTNYTVGATADTGRLTAGGAGATGTQKLVISHNATAVTTINSRVVDNGSAPVQLVANLVNTGTLTLAGANTYTGGTVVNGRNSLGTVSIASGGVIPAGGLTINGGTVSQSTGGAIDPTNAVTINGAGTLTLTGSNTLASLAFNNTGTQNGTNNNPTVNAGTLTLTASTPITAASMSPSTLATINNTLDFGNAAKTITVSPLQFDGTSFAPYTPSLNIAGVVQNSGKITVNGGGLLQVSGGSTFSGGYSVASGSGLYVNANSTPTSGTVTSGPLGTGTLELATGARLLSGGAFTVANAVSMAGSLAFEGVTSLTMSGGVTLPAAGVATIDIPAPQPTLTLSGVLAGNGSSVVKNGYGTLLLSGANTFDGGVTVNRGTLTVGNAAALGSGPLTITGGALDASAASLTVTNPQNWSGGFTFVGTNSLTLSGGVTLGQNSTVGVTAGTLTVAGNIGDGGANRGLTKSGAGTLALTGTNTYGGTTAVNAGVLAISGTAALPGWDTAGRYAVTNGGAIAVPNAVSDADVATMLATGNFTSGGAIGFDTTAGDRTWAAALPAGSGVAKLGTNTLALTAASTHSGPTLVYAGSLTLGNQLAAQNSIISVQSGASVRFDAAVAENAFTVGGLAGAGTVPLTNTAATAITLTIGGSNATTSFSGSLSGAGGLVKQGSGTQTLSGGTINYTGATTINAGTLRLDATTAYAASSTAVAAGARFEVGNTGNQTIAGAITGSGSVVKNGAGTLTLSGANTYTGGTSIEQGTVLLSGTLSATGTITVLAGGTLRMGASDRWGAASTTTSAPIVIGPGGLVESNGFFNTLVDPRFDGGTLALTGGTASGAYALKGTVTVSQRSALGNVSGANNFITIGPTDVDGTLTFDVPRVTSGTDRDLNVQTTVRNPTGRVNSLTKTGNGILLFNSTGEYTGGTIINGGTFRLQGTLPTAAPITVNNGGTLQFGANDRWLNAETTATAPITVNAGGTVLSNNFFNTFINLTLNGGTLRSTGGFDPTWQAYGLKGTVTVGGSSASTIDAGTGGNGNNGINIGPTPNQGGGGFLTFDVADTTGTAAADLTVGVPLRNAFSTASSFNANGITKTGAGTMQINGVNTFTGGLNVNQGVLEVGGAGQLNAGNYAAAIAAAGTFRVASSASQTISGVISGAGRFEKAGTGTLTLTNANNTFNGTAVVEAGTLVVNGTLPSGLSVAAAGWLQGTGTVGGSSAVSGTLSPGNSPGVMTFDTLTLSSTATTVIELPTAGTRGTDYDGVTVTAASGMTYGGSLSFAFGGSSLPNETLFDIFALTGTPSGSFASVTSTGFYTGTWTGAGGVFSLTQGEQQLTFTPTTGDVSIAFVPEPAPIGLAVGGLAALILARRRSRCR